MAVLRFLFIEAFLLQARVGHSALFQRLKDARKQLRESEKDWSEVKLRVQLGESERAEKKSRVGQLKKFITEDESSLITEQAGLEKIVHAKESLRLSILSLHLVK